MKYFKEKQFFRIVNIEKRNCCDLVTILETIFSSHPDKPKYELSHAIPSYTSRFLNISFHSGLINQT